MTLRLVLICIAIGVAAGLLTALVIPVDFEILVWFVVIVVIAWLMINTGMVQLFKQAFIHAAITGMGITATHLTFLNAYLASHPEEKEMLSNWGISSDYLGLLMIAPIYWMILGLLTGAVALLLIRFTSKT